MLTPDLKNLLENDGIGISITGMLVVFFGLALISFAIVALPRVVAWMERERHAGHVSSPEEEAPQLESADEESMLAAAVWTVLQAELELADMDSLDTITLENKSEPSSWVFAGRMRTLSRRS